MMMGRFKTPTSAGSTIIILLISVVCMTYIVMDQSSFYQLTGGVLSTRRKISVSLKNNTNNNNNRLGPPQPRSFEDATFYANMVVEQRRRRALIDEACKAANISREMDLESEDSVFKNVGHLLVDDKYKLLFGFIPKVGCTTWKGLMGRLHHTHQGDLSQIGTLRQFRDNRSEIDYRLQNYRKVLFVREPIPRMLSAYLNKLRNFVESPKTVRIWESFIGRDIVKTYRGYDHIQRYTDEGIKPWMNITLSEYIKYITDRGRDIVMNELNDHWLPLHVVSNPCQIRYDFIGHYENLAVEAPFALKWLGVDHLIPFPPVHASRASEALIKEYAQVPIGLIKRLSAYYSFDYKAFGYHVNDTISILMKGISDEVSVDE